MTLKQQEVRNLHVLNGSVKVVFHYKPFEQKLIIFATYYIVQTIYEVLAIKV